MERQQSPEQSAVSEHNLPQRLLRRMGGIGIEPMTSSVSTKRSYSSLFEHKIAPNPPRNLPERSAYFLMPYP
jgi:hypothetical protein